MDPALPCPAHLWLLGWPPSPGAGLVPPRSCCDHRAHPELESCRGCQGWSCEEVGTALVQEGRKKIPTGRGAWSAAVPRSWSHAAWLGPHVPQCHVPGVVPGLLRCHGPALCPPWSHRWCSPGSDLPNWNSFVPFRRLTLDLPHPQDVPQRCQSCALGVLPALGPQHPQPCPRWGQARGCHPAMGTLWQGQGWPWCLSCCRELLGAGLRCPPSCMSPQVLGDPSWVTGLLPARGGSEHSRSPWAATLVPFWAHLSPPGTTPSEKDPVPPLGHWPCPGATWDRWERRGVTGRAGKPRNNWLLHRCSRWPRRRRRQRARRRPGARKVPPGRARGARNRPREPSTWCPRP